MSKLLKTKNRLVSFICILFFVCGIALSSLVSVKLIKDYKTRQDLIDQRDELLEEKEYQDNAPLGEDYYVVYVKDNYSIYDTSGTIFVFSK